MPQYQNRPVTANAILIKEDQILLIKRNREPFKDCWANAGGFVEITETTGECATRELKEETGVDGKILQLIGIYDDPGRDPTRHTVNVAYLVEPAGEVVLKANDDAEEAQFFKLDNLPPLAFDHAKQIEDAKKLIK